MDCHVSDVQTHSLNSFSAWLHLITITSLETLLTLHSSDNHSATMYLTSFSGHVPSVLWRCCLRIRNSIRRVKNWVMTCWCGYLSGVRCRLFAYGPADATASQAPSSLASFKSRLVLPFWYRLTQVVLKKRLLNVCSGSSFSGLILLAGDKMCLWRVPLAISKFFLEDWDKPGVPSNFETRSSAIAEGPRDAPCQLKSCQLPRNSAETACMTSREPSISCR